MDILKYIQTQFYYFRLKFVPIEITGLPTANVNSLATLGESINAEPSRLDCEVSNRSWLIFHNPGTGLTLATH